MKIAFYKTVRPGIQGIFSRLVRWWTNGPYSHCELIVEDFKNGTALCASSSFIDHGVRVKRIKLNPDHWDILEIGACSISADTALAWFTGLSGHSYDVLGLVGFIWRRQDGSKQRWFCSEAVAAALHLEDPWRYSPNTLSAVVRSWRRNQT